MQKKTAFSDYRVLKVSGGDLLREKPLFCNEGKNLIVSNGETCHLYSTSSGEHLLELFTADSPIVALQINAKDPNQLFAFSEKGVLTKYFFDTEIQESNCCQLALSTDLLEKDKVCKFLESNKSYECGTEDNVDWNVEIESVKFIQATVREGLVYASWCVPGESYAHLSTFNLSNGKQVGKPVNPIIYLQCCSQNFIIENNVLLAMSRTYIYVSSLEKRMTRKHLMKDTVQLTCIAMNREASAIAVGDTDGKITVFRNAFEKYPLKDVYHWHTLPVRALTLTDYGAHMLSGAEENVLVKWSLASQMKTFLPRVSSSIHQLVSAPGSSVFAMSTSDSRIHIVDLNLKPLTVIQHFSSWTSLSVVEPSKILTQDPRTEALVLGGRTGHVQFLSAVDDGRFMYTLDVTNRNYITRERRCVNENIEVRFAKFSRCGKWLITAEIGANDSRLKFWEFIGEKQEFSLNTEVDAPHGPNITCLEVSSDELAITCGNDDRFRFWGIVESVHMQQLKLHWAQLGTGAYRSLPITIANFSRDGSLAGVGFGPALTLWDTDNSTLKCSLTPPLKRNPVQHIHFGNHDVSHLIVTGTNVEVTCWNIVTLCMQWVVPLNLAVIISDPNSVYMCAFSKKGSLFIFNPASASPELRLENVCGGEVVAGLFLAKAEAPFLYFLNNRQELFCLGEEVQKKTKSIEVSKISLFVSHLAQKSRKDVIAPESMQEIITPATSFPTEILDLPSHSLPSMAMLCSDIIRSLLLTVPSTDKKTESRKDEVSVLSGSKVERAVTLNEAELQKVVDTLFS